MRLEFVEHEFNKSRRLVKSGSDKFQPH